VSRTVNRTKCSVQDFPFRLIPQESRQQRLLVNGNQAVAREKLAAGMCIQTYYPTSPATDESVYLEALETFPTTDGEEGQGSWCRPKTHWRRLPWLLAPL
ncbi:MAG TPA: hypothetical protein VGC99_08320, partial [Candidatus Tectomicrobia bacterium]